jgi:hypothetical protein
LRHEVTLPWLLLSGSRSTVVPLAALGALGLLAVLACGPSQTSASPEASLAGASRAQAEFRLLRGRFFDADAQGRARMLTRLNEFLALFPRDERAHDVRIYLAFAYVERGDRASARKLLAPVLAGPAGSQRDFASVAQAAVLAREGETERALAALDALGGRIIDLDERYVYGEERARTAFMSGDYELALRALLDWLVQSPPDRKARARKAATTLIDRVPTDALVAALGTLRPMEGARQELAEGRSWLVGAVVARLTHVALERSSASLARHLLEVAPAALRGTPEGKKLVELAASGSRAPAVAGRAVGLLLGLGSTSERRRAAAISHGMTRALGTNDQPTSAAGVALIVRYGTDDVPGAFTALAADGAALIVAGGDDESARRAAAQAETLRIPLLLLRPPEVPPRANGFTFVLGLDDGVVLDTVAEALAMRGARQLERVGPGGTPCDVEAPGAGRPRFPHASWRKAGVEALLVTGDAECAADLARELAAARLAWPLGLGLDAGRAYATLGRPAFVVKTGKFPDQLGESGWYEALGHDAGVLSARALEALPLAGVAHGEDVEALRERARGALERAEADLQTSTARGFGGARVLPRELSVIQGGPTR